MKSHVSNTWVSKKILPWYAKKGRHHLPWKDPVTPYRVWVSEIMLQQTQVATVIPYFEKFMQAFPCVSDLANASLGSVLHYWAGLGYYARGRHLHQSAKLIVDTFNGQFPQSVEALLTLPGIGLSTAGAIVAQAFNKKATICDGNVKRVLARFHRLNGPLGQKEVEQHLWQLAEFYTPSKHVADYTQAIMDIGATICTRSAPFCKACPLHTQCQAFLKDNPTNYPQKSKRKTLLLRKKWVGCILNHRQEILLEQRPNKGIWGGLWSLPEYDSKEGLATLIKTLGKALQAQELPELKHSFTHFRLLIVPKLFLLKNSPKLTNPKLRWVTADSLKTLGLPAPIQKIVNYEIIRQKMSKP